MCYEQNRNFRKLYEQKAPCKYANADTTAMSLNSSQPRMYSDCVVNTTAMLRNYYGYLCPRDRVSETIIISLNCRDHDVSG